MKMKNKKALQKEAREKHRKFLRKNRKDEPELDRNKPSKYEKPTILIVCEGKNTEPSYFRQFKLTTAEVKPIGEGYNTVTLVNRAIELSQKGYDQVWCVFDKDDFPNTDFNNAIQIAKAQNFGVAYSNQAFEYWILLHFDDHQGGGMHRNQYDEKINNHLKNFGLSYDGQNSKVITEEIFDLLESIDEKFEKDRKTLAIERAKRIYNRLNKISPAKEESSTTVFKLVEELNKYI
jgi:hypothetical protein|tara:strand:- start:107 stop:808 length:702 start_codon:yes stop_codon:yes gene_type:complete